MGILSNKIALHRGLGRVYLEVKKDPKACLPLMRWAAYSPTAFDEQCEGTRAPYIYGLFKLYDDPTPFLEKTADKLYETAPNDPAFNYLVELLAIAAGDNSLLAWQALEDAFDNLYLTLVAIKERPDDFFPERDALEVLCLYLAKHKVYTPGELSKKLRDLISENPLFTEEDFDQFFELYVSPPIDRTPFVLSKQKKDLPPDIDELIADAENKEADDWVRLSAIHHLTDLEDERVHALALRLIDEDPQDGVILLAANYQESDEENFVHNVKRVYCDLHDGQNWHAMHLAVLSMREDHGKLPPLEALYHIYEYTYCSCCRHRAVKELAVQNALTREILAEAIYDADFDTRAFIQDLLS